VWQVGGEGYWEVYWQEKMIPRLPAAELTGQQDEMSYHLNPV
jgi:hypothetical protein